MELDVLVALLRGENVRVNAHVYKSNDMEMLIRIAQEYNIKSLSFHHATEAYKIADILRENNISTAIFTDNWGKKSEAWDASVHMPKILVDSGVKMAIKSDHPIINGKNLIYDAAKAMFYGMSPDATMRAITSVPASIIGVSDRIGALKEGYDGDIVLWDKHPLSLGARPDTIIIDGNVVLHRNHAIVSTSLEPEYMPEPATETLELNNAPIITETHDFKCYAVKGAVIHVQDEKDTIIQSGTIVVVHGTIKCMKQTCEIPPSCNVYQSSHPIHIIPGLIESSSSLGLVEIVTESQAHEGSAETRNKGENPDLHAIDGLRLFNSRTIPAARKNGVTVSISHPKNDALVMGTSVAYYLLDNHRIEEVLVKETTGLHITLGIDSVHDLNNAVMAQLHDLRVLLEKKQKEILSRKLKRKSELGNLKDQLLNNDIVVRVLRKEIPLVAHVNQVDVMNHLLRMQKLFKFRLVIVGGAEAHLIAKTLAKQEVSVIITPSKKGHAAHQRWDTMLTDSCDFGISILHSAGVKLGISVGYAHYARDLRWIAGKVQQSGNEQGKRVLKESQTLAMITKNVAQMFGLYEQGLGQLREKDVANFVVLIGKNVLTFESRVRVVAVGSRVETKPIQR
jgi:imidazolonepropionase-like amidohydrolase